MLGDLWKLTRVKNSGLVNQGKGKSAGLVTGESKIPQAAMCKGFLRVGRRR
jgi:hypothetical protein